jgi:hypothetical protein
MDEKQMRVAMGQPDPGRRQIVAHKFGLGQSLVFTPGAEFAVRDPARCTVTRLLPKEGADFQYHVRIDLDGQQRRAWENQLQYEKTRTG